MPTWKSNYPYPAFRETNVVGVRGLVKPKHIWDGSLIVALKVSPERVRVPTIKTLDTRKLAADLTESARAIDNKRGFGFELGTGTDVFDGNHIPFGRKDGILDVGLMSVPDINSIALSDQRKEQLGHGSFDLEPRKEELKHKCETN